MTSEYKTICYYSDEDQAFIMFAPDLPGCFADGETIEEAKENISEIIGEWIEYASELGRDIPPALKELESTSPSVFDVAKYVLSKTGPISTVMLQKLVYYCQSWSLAWFQTPLFPQKFEAWSRGPVCRALYNRHKGRYVISESEINSTHALSASEKKLIEDVLSVYKNEDPEWLSQLTHSELPWQKARTGLPQNSRSDNVIDESVMKQYYGSFA